MNDTIRIQLSPGDKICGDCIHFEQENSEGWGYCKKRDCWAYFGEICKYHEERGEA